MQPQQTDDQFLSSMGLDGLNDEQKQKALETITRSLNLAMASRISEALNEEHLDQFQGLLDRDAPQEEIDQWLQQNVPDYQEILKQETQKLQTEYLEMQKSVLG